MASLIFSVIAFVWAQTAKTESKENAKHLQMFELSAYKEREEDKKKALIDAKVYKSSDEWLLNVCNRGIATAQNIRMIVQDSEIASESFYFIDAAIPYPFLHHGGSFDIQLFLAQTRKPTIVVKFIWDDDSNNNNERDVVLNLF